MFHERNDTISLTTRRTEQGWLMPVAAVIVVVMGLLAAGLATITSTSNVSGAQEQITVQTFYVAESGAQYAMNQLFFNSAAPVDTTFANARCAAINSTSINLNALGMQNCAADLNCTAVFEPGSGNTFYQITSRGRCGSGELRADRTINVAASL